MKKAGRSIPAMFLVIAMFAFSCGNRDRNVSNGEKSILFSAPYSNLTDSIGRFPDQAALYLRRAVLLTQNNQHEIAGSDYSKAWQLKPDAETGYRYVSNLSIQGKISATIKILQDCIQKFPAEMEFTRLLSEAYVESGNPSGAMKLYDTLLQKDPKDFEAWYEKGLLLAQIKDTPMAIAALEKAYSIQPVTTYGLELAHLYAEIKNPICLKLCDDVISKDSANELIDPFFVKGIYYSNIAQYPQSIVQFDSCIQRDWKFTDAYIEKGISLFKQKNFDEALNTFRMAATVSNTYPDAYHWIGRCFEAINRKEEAQSNYERALSLDKKFTEAREAINRMKK